MISQLLDPLLAVHQKDADLPGDNFCSGVDEDPVAVMISGLHAVSMHPRHIGGASGRLAEQLEILRRFQARLFACAGAKGQLIFRHRETDFRSQLRRRLFSVLLERGLGGLLLFFVISDRKSVV